MHQPDVNASAGPVPDSKTELRRGNIKAGEKAAAVDPEPESPEQMSLEDMLFCENEEKTGGGRNNPSPK